ncbi:hypothetical protein M0R45_010081 [Rubus argutus]|uniref:Uncharacterized protein n=1 Tax=Rubus argutus TaxID=59490 RepID=A0AAW1Y8J0_RUBAR
MVLTNEADGHESKFIKKIVRVQMHDMIRDMGRGIVRLESKKPGERSRLWHHKDSFQVLTENNGTQTIEGLVLNMHMLPAFAPSRNSNTLLYRLIFHWRALFALEMCHSGFATTLEGKNESSLTKDPKSQLLS